MMIEALELMVDESGERPRDAGTDEASSSAEREVREGIKEQEEIKRSVRATWEVGEEGHELNMHAQPLWFLLFDFSFFFFLSFSFRASTTNTTRNKKRTQTQTQTQLGLYI